MLDKQVQPFQGGRAAPEDIPVQVFWHGQQLVAINNRGLAAHSLAGLRPVNVMLAQPTAEVLGRLGETETYDLPGKGRQQITSPDYTMALTEELKSKQARHIVTSV